MDATIQQLVYARKTGQISNVTFMDAFKGFRSITTVPYRWNDVDSVDSFIDICASCEEYKDDCKCPEPSLYCEECASRTIDEQDPFVEVE